MCEQCKNLTTGKQCQDCMPGYYGDPTNGGQCTGNFFFFLSPQCIFSTEKKIEKSKPLVEIYFIKEFFQLYLNIFGR